MLNVLISLNFIFSQEFKDSSNQLDEEEKEAPEMYPYCELCLKSIYDVFRQNGYDEIRDGAFGLETSTTFFRSSKTSNILKKKFLRINEGKPNKKQIDSSDTDKGIGKDGMKKDTNKLKLQKTR
jgi:hypothetical protein